ncbi:unnamed protein product, partial [Gulo gulo]
MPGRPCPRLWGHRGGVLCSEQGERAADVTQYDAPHGRDGMWPGTRRGSYPSLGSRGGGVREHFSKEVLLKPVHLKFGSA